MDEKRTPVLIGCGQITDRVNPAEGKTPVSLMALAAQLAAEDAGPGAALLNAIDAMVAVGLVVDSPEAANGAAGMYRNVPQTVCNLLCIDPPQKRYTHPGGNTPQMLVNHYAQQIAQGKANAVLLTGAEALASMIGRLKQGLSIQDWSDDPGTDPTMIGDGRPAASDHEMSYGIQTPANTYPLFENALRGKYGWTLAEHQLNLGELYQRFNQVAAGNPLSWFPKPRDAREISSPSDDNRFVGYPYTKYLNAVIQVNQGASVIMTSVAQARELGVASHRMVYLHGCADAIDTWNVTQRANYHSSPAIRHMGEHAFAMADKTVADMDFLDIYSCFPSAVQIACDELGIAHDDPRGLTVTGGLPYFGGAGNNYAMHSIATMMQRLRDKPGSFGMLNALGWFITKHALGIYSTTPVSEPRQFNPSDAYEDRPTQGAYPSFTETPQGSATIETYTVLHGRKGPERGLVVGRLSDGTRFLADTPNDPLLLRKLTQVDALGMPGIVSCEQGRNLFLPVFAD
ncbi:MAG: acetyl-CoA acetyltransferase [Halioglobus sp.]